MLSTFLKNICRVRARCVLVCVRACVRACVCVCTMRPGFLTSITPTKNKQQLNYPITPAITNYY